MTVLRRLDAVLEFDTGIESRAVHARKVIDMIFFVEGGE
jgi:hypothetical protein